MSSAYDPSLVTLSILIAVVASYTALDLAGRVTTTLGQTRISWLIGGAIAMGIGIWSMHFVGMLALSMPIAIFYDLPGVLFSIVPAILASGGALWLASRTVLSIQQLLLGGMLMGIGIAFMHYSGMAAMRMDASVHYDPLLFIVSVGIAIGASVVALWIAFKLRTQSGKPRKLPQILSALVMGLAISGMHYTGMAAAQFTPTKAVVAVSSKIMQASLTWLAVGIGIGTLIILCFTLLTSFIDRQIVDQTMQLMAQKEASSQQAELFTNITLRIRQSLKLEDVLNTAVNEICQALKLERVIIYRFNSDWSGIVIAESVIEGLNKILGKTTTTKFWDWKDYIGKYSSGQVWAVNNVYTESLTDSQRQSLEEFEVKAYIAAPILEKNQLLGLLFVHQCSQPRVWQQHEIDLCAQLAIQIGVAIEQANLLTQLSSVQETLKLQERAIAAATNGIVISDPKLPDNPLIFCNPAFEKITGYSLRDVLGTNCRFLQGPQTDPAIVEQIRNAVSEERECQVVLKNYRQDGTSFWNELTISPVRDTNGKVINFIGVLVDITERKQVEEEIRLSKETLQKHLAELLDDIKEAAQGDLTVYAEVTSGEIGIVADFFNNIIESLRRIVAAVKVATEKVNMCVGENSIAIQHLADEAFKQAEEITHTLESLDHMVMSIQAVAESAHQAAAMVRAASATAEAGGVAMERTVSSILNLQSTASETVKKVKRLGDSSQEISKVVSLIDQIAMQTNLLSLNTSIEAAKVGEEGQAFTVVAEEVSRLAVQSVQATKEIQQIVENIQLETAEVIQSVELGMDQVVEGTNLVKDAKQSLEQIIEVSRQIDLLAQSISSATVSQVQTSQSVASLMEQIAQASFSTSYFSRQASSSLQETVEVAQKLQTSVSVFKTSH
jgi:methyl-accepting chemotaxis protein PixJ